MIPHGPANRAGFRRRRERAAACLADLSRRALPVPAPARMMEDRTLLSTFLVNTTADSGPGSLRQAILDSNAATGSHQHDRLRHLRARACRRSRRLAPARDHQSRADRRRFPAGLRRHAADRAERQPGRQRRRPDDHRRRTSPSAAWTSTISARAPAFTSRAPAPRAIGSMATSWGPIRPARRPRPTTTASRSTGGPATTSSEPMATASTTRPSGT